MTIQIDKEIIELLSKSDTQKVIATTDRYGEPHVVFKNNIFIESGNIVLLELIETSQTNNNLVNSIWFNRKVAINIKGVNNQSWQIKGIPVKTHISGHIYEKYYKISEEENPNIDLGAVWIIKPTKIINNEFNNILQDEKRKHPYLFHLDKIVKKD
ncbi:MAG: hypothetical protein ABF633_07575 [Clostridium sp.]|uniref:hypothetical protein n=1 Tax=Clostridium sp. TaxID=1506 RepID=UPI0039E9547D